MTDLKTKLLEADGGSRELDKQIWQLLVPNVTRRTIHVAHHSKPYDIDETRDASGRLIVVPSYTTSLDGALALVEEVLPGWTIARIGQDDSKAWWAELRKGFTTSYSRVAGGSHKSPAIAIILALLSALEGEES